MRTCAVCHNFQFLQFISTPSVLTDMYTLIKHCKNYAQWIKTMHKRMLTFSCTLGHSSPECITWIGIHFVYTQELFSDIQFWRTTTWNRSMHYWWSSWYLESLFCVNGAMCIFSSFSANKWISTFLIYVTVGIKVVQIEKLSSIHFTSSKNSYS